LVGAVDRGVDQDVPTDPAGFRAPHFRYIEEFELPLSADGLRAERVAIRADYANVIV
jgi:hypothetical protein